MAKRRLSTSLGSDNIRVTQRNVRQKTSADSTIPVTTTRTLECVLIPAAEQLACVQSVQSTPGASRMSPSAIEDGPQPIDEKSPVPQNRRFSKFGSHQSTIANFFRADSTQRAGKAPEKDSESELDKQKDDTKHGEEQAVQTGANRRPRRSAARQSYVVEMLDDSEDELAAPAAVDRKRGHVSTAKRAAGDSDFEHELDSSEGDASQDEQQSEATESEPETEEGSNSDEGYGSSLKSKSKSKKVPKTITPGKSIPRGFSKTGRKTGKSTASDMSKFLNRSSGETKGLKLSLPPMSKIDSIFQDITAKALALGLKDFLNGNHGPLRVATMCSGTESPLLALEMVQDALKSAGSHELKIDHLFSAEIVPYKQAYIERNFHPPIIFRDISEITESVQSESTPTATTVYGAKLPVPGNVHILIAGTSCVDFSRLNKHRKQLDQENGGESSKTWFGVLSYVKACRPAIVILENVLHGPWDLMMQSYREIGYEVGGVLLDTKNYYLPHTRQRGYLVCFDKEKASGSIEGAGKKWQSMMGEFRRYASSSVAEFLLPTEMVRAQQYSSIDDSSRDYDWAACEIRHIQYRQNKRLGNGRPLTFWSESGTMSVPENGFQSWYRKQPERVRDYMDIALLRKAPLFDVRFKTRIWDVSQNVDLFGDSTSFGITPCITPSGLFFASDAGRALAPEELLMMQGLPLKKISFTTESGPEIQDLAGNAMTTTVVGPAILSAIICGQSVLHPSHQEADVSDEMEIEGSSISTIADVPTESVESLATQEPDLARLIDQAAISARQCLCEGAYGVAEKPIQKCVDCGHTTCTACAGNPMHNYQLELPLNRSRRDPVEFEQHLRQCLPQCLKFDHIHEQPSTGKDEYSAALTKAFSETFFFSRVQRTHQWKVIYQSPSAQLELVLYGPRAYWQLFARPGEALPVNSEMRALLNQPVAIAQCYGSLLNNDWKWRSLSLKSHRLQITSEGPKIASWLSRIGLPDYREQQVPSVLRIHVPSDVVGKTGHDLNGRYQALPHCGTAEDSLYRKIDGSQSEQIYLFKSPSRTGDPKLDCFVFTQDKERLDYSEHRLAIARIDPAWAPWTEGKDFTSPYMTLAADWRPCSMALGAVDQGLQVQIPAAFGLSSLQFSCQQAELIMRCNLTTTACRGVKDIDAKDEDFFTKYAYAIESMRRHLPTPEWQCMSLDTCSCLVCAPPKPGLRWMLGDGKAVKPYEDPASAAIYERSIKQRPKTMFFQLSNVDSHDTISLGLNLASLAHRAISRLPQDQIATPILTWNLEPSMASGNAFKQKPFALKKTEAPSSVTDVGMRCSLFPKQASVLQWMRQQEAGCTFLTEEAEEAVIPAIGWRAEVRAQSEVTVRGGICADHPGFGKTITSLALIHSHLVSGQDIVADLHQRQQESPEAVKNLIATQATLIVAPHTLVKQWMSEIKDKLGYSDGVLCVVSWKDLNKFTISDFEKAKIIIVNRSVFGQAEYAERLANFAAMPGPATNSGRAFSQWLDFACEKIPEHLEILRGRGLSELRKHVKDRYAELMNSEEFKAVVPSRRLIGKELTESKGKAAQKALKAAPKAVQTDNIHRPLFEMFYFNRIIVDEFHQYTPREYASLKTLKADKRWGLSGTPALSDFYDISQMAGLLGIKLRIGSDSARIMAQRNVRALRKDMTDFERFDSMREMPSDSMHARIHEIAQSFLDAFVRQNVMDFDEMTYDDYVVPVTLDADHHSAYSELAQQLSSQDMNIRKAKSSKTTTRDKRFMAAIADVQTAEEALSRDAAWFEAKGLDHMIKARQIEVDATLKDLRSACFAAQHEVKGLNESLNQTVNTLIEDRVLGDQETIDLVKDALTSTARPGAQMEKSKENKKSNKKRSSGEDGEKKDKDDPKGRELTSHVNALAKALLTFVRSKRFVSNVQRIRDSSEDAAICDSEGCSEDGMAKRSTAVSALCGHCVCMDCYTASKAQHNTLCNAKGCGASQQDYHLLWSHTLNQSNSSTSHGAKLDRAIHLLKDIRSKDEKAILFVQFTEQLEQADSALQEAGIAATVVVHQSTAGQQIADFRDNDDTVIVLNASDETAAGSNLQAANHVIFLSPLLRDSQYGYDSTMAQAIGRVRRHGQQRRIHVYRICALHTIDVDILEHRERRTTALIEPGAPQISPNTMTSDSGHERGSSSLERVQLVKETGAFSLRPRSWLHSGGKEGADEAEILRLGGRNRVVGWEDFSSQIKFSRAFAGNDE